MNGNMNFMPALFWHVAVCRLHGVAPRWRPLLRSALPSVYEKVYDSRIVEFVIARICGSGC